MFYYQSALVSYSYFKDTGSGPHYGMRHNGHYTSDFNKGVADLLVLLDAASAVMSHWMGTSKGIIVFLGYVLSILHVLPVLSFSFFLC